MVTRDHKPLCKLMRVSVTFKPSGHLGLPSGSKRTFGGKGACSHTALDLLRLAGWDDYMTLPHFDDSLSGVSVAGLEQLNQRFYSFAVYGESFTQGPGDHSRICLHSTFDHLIDHIETNDWLFRYPWIASYEHGDK